MALWAVVLLLCAAWAPSQAQPAAGVYTVIRSDVLSAWSWDLSFILGDKVNTYTNYPSVSGSSNGASYTFSGWRVTVFPIGGTLVPNTNALDFDWGSFYFEIQFNWHVKKDIISESGWGRIYTTDGNVKLTMPINMNMEGETVSAGAGQVWLSFNSGDIEVYIKCTDWICLIPPQDIANAVAQNFDSSFLKGVTAGVNDVCQDYIDGASTIHSLSSLGLNLWLEGNAYNFNNNLAVAAIGAILPSNDGTIPFYPSSAPPSSVLNSPPGQLNIIFTGYTPQTAFWSLQQEGYFNHVITQKNMPSGAPFTLNTSDPFWLAIAPGLASWPNYAMQVTTSATQTPQVTITSGVITSVLTVNANFLGVHFAKQQALFNLAIQIQFGTTLSTKMNGAAIQLNAAFENFQGSVSLVQNWSGGSVDTQGLGQLLTSVLPSMFPASLSENVNPPADFAFAAPSVSINQGYAIISSDLSFTGSVPTVPCGNGVCVVGTTCCDNNSRCCFPSSPLPGLSEILSMPVKQRE